MRLNAGLLFVGAIATTSAQTEFTVPSAGECIDVCNEKAATGILDSFSTDPKSSNLVASLGLMCDKTGPSYSKFMMVAGMCMSSCTKEEQTAFNEYHTKACDWYKVNKEVTLTTPSSSVVSSATSSAVSTDISPTVTSSVISVLSHTSLSSQISTASSSPSTSSSSDKVPTSIASNLKNSFVILLGSAAFTLLTLY